MFLKFFGLNDNPFKMVFDPAYIYMGRHQEEALAHLRYAVDEGEGFTVIIGEQGVGKSTLCRIFAESLNANAKSAFISEPVSTAGDLLRRINRQFGLDAEGRAAKELIDSLNEYLMRQRVAGKKVVVFIDDAQALAPEVLEQVRLISNLETTRDKLIQLVLIGEPELLDLLSSRALRQMGQRVSVRYTVGRLSETETSAYIHHRLTRASAGSPLRFDPAVVRLVFSQSAGNPQKINMSCAALLAAAFKAGTKTIDLKFARSILQGAERQTGQSPAPQAPGRRRLNFRFWGGVGGVLVAFLASVFILRSTREPPIVPEEKGALQQPAEWVPPVPAPPAAVAPSDTEPPPAAPVAVSQPVEEIPAPPAREPEPRMTHFVQVGAFLQPENAQSVMARLSAKGYPAQIHNFTDSRGRAWLTVRIGNHPSRQAAQAQADEFKRREQMEAVVRSLNR
jgi:general secretion pathway protein A